MIEQIRPSELGTWLQAQAHAPGVVLDVRESWEWQTARVQENGFVLKHIPMGELATRVDELDRGTPVACLCHHGVRSQHVALFLARLGFERVANITGGIHAWSEQTDPTIPLY